MRVSIDEAVTQIQSNHKVFIHSVAAAPQALIRAMTARAHDLRGVEIYQIHTEGDAPYTDLKLIDSFHTNAMFVGKNVRHAVNHHNGSYIPIFLSEAGNLFRRGIIPLDVALISVSPPDEHGYCSLGPSVDCTRAAVENAKIVIAQVNKHIPRTHGDGVIKFEAIHFTVEHDEAIHEVPSRPIDEHSQKIGEHIAGMIDDGATLQMGIGAIPDAVLSCLGNHKNLGVHTEMFSDGLIPLLKSGVVNNRLKKIHPRITVSSFVMGTRQVYDFIHDNPGVMMREASFVNSVHIIQKNPKVTAINSAIEVDLTGQVSADSIGQVMYSGVGGQMDFIRGASLSEGGLPIIALPSQTRRGESKIVSMLKPGAGVVTSRAHVHYVVTEYGVANLYGKNLAQRARALINIAHPDHREELERQSYYLDEN